MLDKILKMFFVKEENKQKVVTILRQPDLVSIKRETPKNIEKETNVKTSLSKYFTHHRGLNLLERGFTYCDDNFLRKN